MSARAAGSRPAGSGSAARPGLLSLLAGVFALEGLGLVVLLVLLIVEIAGAGRGVNAPSALALAVLDAVGVVLLAALARGALRASPWVLAGGTVWQVLQLFVALGALQGTGTQPVLALVVGVPAIAGLVLLFAPSVRLALRRPGRDETDRPG